MLDLRHYARTADKTWLTVHAERLQKQGKNLDDMIRAIGDALDKLPAGSFIDIEKSVKPENHEVFIKIATDYMDTEYDYRFNKLMNKVYNEPITMPKKQDEKKGQTMDKR